MQPLDEKDLVQIFTTNDKKSNLAETSLVYISRTLIFIVSLIVVYIAVNFNAFKDSFNFWYKYDFQANEPAVTDIKVPEIVTKTPTGQASKSAQSQSVLPEMPDNSILVPALSLHAPITWRVNNTPKEVHDNLAKGVIQVNGTSLPGEKGNIYVTGHSSNYVWSTGDYKSVFSVISHLVAGDYIYIKFDGQVFAYKVFDQRVVSPTDLSSLENTQDSRLTLGTCWPLGTSLKRLIVIANQVYPDPANNKESRETINFQKLPGR